MRILLINPPQPTTMETFSTLGIVAPPLGLAYLAGVLEREGYSVSILDAPALNASYRQIRSEMERIKPDVVGLTSTTATINQAVEVSKIAEEVCPDASVVIGGPHVSFTAEETLLENPSIDIVCIGEGENTLFEFVQTQEDGGNLAHVKGIAYRRKDGGVVTNSRRELIEDLDDLPFPARHLLPVDRYSVLGKFFPATIMTSRGCPFNCIFCSSSLLFGRRFRARSPKNVVGEVESVYDDFRCKYVEFLDDTFTLNSKRVNEICQELRDRNLGVQWVCSSRVDTITRELMQRMKDAGCIMIYFGVESGDQSIIEMMKKGIRIEQSVKAIRWAKEVGIKTVGSFIIGIPGETKQAIKQTIRFAKKLNPDFAQFSIATPYPGTELYDAARKHNWLKIRGWSEYTVLRPIIETVDFSKNELSHLLTEAYLKFYLRPEKLIFSIKEGYFQKVARGFASYLWRRLRDMF